jgi:hypothetical protein
MDRSRSGKYVLLHRKLKEYPDKFFNPSIYPHLSIFVMLAFCVVSTRMLLNLQNHELTIYEIHRDSRTKKDSNLEWETTRQIKHVRPGKPATNTATKWAEAHDLEIAPSRQKPALFTATCGLSHLTQRRVFLELNLTQKSSRKCCSCGRTLRTIKSLPQWVCCV